MFESIVLILAVFGAVSLIAMVVYGIIRFFKWDWEQHEKEIMGEIRLTDGDSGVELYKKLRKEGVLK